MKEKRILYAIGYVNDSYIEEMYKNENASTLKRSPRRILLIAAIIALIALLVGCTVVYVLGLDQMIIGTESLEGWTGKTETRTRLSMQGFVGSPSYMGAKEWFEFEQTYDPDNQIMQSLSNEEMIMPEEYWSYNCYTPEMTAKVDEICRKYGLEKQGPAIILLDEADFYSALQIEQIVKADASAEVEISPQYFYKTGTFMLACETMLTGDNSPWAYPIEYQYYCVMKTDLEDVCLGAKNIETYDQWEYTTQDGVHLLLVIGETNALLVADLQSAFVTMNITNAQEGDILKGEQKISREAMEAFAETFDFSFVPRRPTEEQIEEINAKHDAYWAEFSAQREAEQEKFQEYLGRASYDARVKYHLENDAEPTRMGYTFYDFDNNGVEELVIGRDGYIDYIYTEKNGETGEILGWLQMGVTYLSTDGTLVIMSDNTYRFFHIENGERVMDYWVERRPYWEDSPWRLCYSIDDDRPISEEEYIRLRTEKDRVVLEMLPLTEYPLSEPANYSTEGIDMVRYAHVETYEDLIRERILSPVEKEPEVFYESHYVLKDLDGDRQNELIIDDEYSRAIYTMKNGKMVSMYTGSSLASTELNICKGNIIELIHAYSRENKVYCYYRMSGTTGKMVEYLRYDADRNPSNPWFRSTDVTGQDTSLIPITKAEFDNIRQTYAHIELDWKPVEEYPLS